MTLQDASSLIKLFASKGISEIDLLGGEPLLVPWTKDFVLYTIENGITLNISTNGSLPETVKELAEISTDFLNIGFSVHGFSETHNAMTGSDNFHKTIKGIEAMIVAGKTPHVKSVLLHENVNEIFYLAAYLRDIGVHRYYLMYEDTIGRKLQNSSFSFPVFMDFYQNLKNSMHGQLEIGFVAASGFLSESRESGVRCKAGIEKLALLPDGSVFPCNLFAGFKEFCIGNIFIDDYEKILKNPVLRHFRVFEKNECLHMDCSRFSSCRGGCPAHIYYFYNSLKGTDPRCHIQK